jgi:hypothetical protein
MIYLRVGNLSCCIGVEAKVVAAPIIIAGQPWEWKWVARDKQALCPHVTSPRFSQYYNLVCIVNFVLAKEIT